MSESGAYVFFWGLMAFAVGAVVLLAGLLRWALTDPDVDRDIAKDRFQSEQDWRAVRRSGKLWSPRPRVVCNAEKSALRK